MSILKENVEIKHSKRLFSNRDLWLLFVPLVIEQGLEYIVGLADSIMVANVGEAAVSGVSLVDSVMALFISIFTALATGGGVVIGQYLGSKNYNKAKLSVNQFVKFTLYFSIVIMLLIYFLKSFILNSLFGQISPEVKEAADIYFMIVTLSIPFLAMYNCGAAVFRTIGNSKLPMKIMLYMNILNVIGNAILVFGFKMGVAGVAIPTLVSRVGAAIIVLLLARNKKNELYIIGFFKEKFNLEMVKKILSIGLPFGLENGMFYLGRLIVLSVVSLFGTASIAANAVGGTINMFEVLPGVAINLGLAVVISKCVGAGDFAQAKYYKKKVEWIMRITFVLSTIVVVGLMPLLMKIYNLSQEATRLVWIIVVSHGVMMILIWSKSFMLPVVFRSAGDAKFPMITSTFSMIVFRIVFAYVFSLYFGMGMIGTWVAMYVDWIFRTITYMIRYRKGTWMRYKIV
ncbi:MATE family efflux transporter [Fusobacterium simiae]|uniref:Multidrug-efflux transporter n=1 Tax=Fusobacterium simiae TaxID=855 RepID=A0ABT4DLV0_FUSSI|nr:MATE family efflux transporter [Fusobacterium simiae]MCY7008958.1 MATE family efflux transporter [Fusobacterium simiae]